MRRLANTLAFELRCIRSGCVVPLMPINEHDIGYRWYPRERTSFESGALPRRTFKYASVVRLAGRGASTFSVL